MFSCSYNTKITGFVSDLILAAELLSVWLSLVNSSIAFKCINLRMGNDPGGKALGKKKSIRKCAKGKKV